MLTPQEAARLEELIDGTRPAQDGMEKHFLRVIDGLALPFSPREREWYEHWQSLSRNAGRSEDYRSKYEETIALLGGREETIRVLEDRVNELELQISQLLPESHAANEEATRLRTAHKAAWGEVEKRKQETHQLKTLHETEIRELKLKIAKYQQELGIAPTEKQLTEQERWERLPDGSGNNWREQK